MDLEKKHIDALALAESLMFHSDFCPYLELKELLADGSELARVQFKNLFTTYYRLNAARLSPTYKEVFFRYLFDRKGIVTGHPDLRIIVKDVGKFHRTNGRSTTQYSFVSKLAGIHCESSPLYDREVRRFFGAKRFKGRDARLEQCDVVRLMDFLVWKSGEAKLSVRSVPS